MTDDWMVQRGFVACTVRALRDDPAVAVPEAIREVYGVAPQPCARGGDVALSRDVLGRGVLELSCDPGEGRAIVARLAVAWRTPVRWAAMRVEYQDYRNPACTTSLSDGGFDREGRPVAASPPVDEPEADADWLDTDHPGRVRDWLMTHVLESWNVQRDPDLARWTVAPPPLPDEPRLAAVVRGLRAARTKSVVPDGDRVRVEAVPWEGGREVWFLLREQALRLGLVD